MGEDQDGSTFVINGVTVIFVEPANEIVVVDVEDLIDTITVDLTAPEPDVNLCSPTAV